MVSKEPGPLRWICFPCCHNTFFFHFFNLKRPRVPNIRTKILSFWSLFFWLCLPNICWFLHSVTLCFCWRSFRFLQTYSHSNFVEGKLFYIFFESNRVCVTSFEVNKYFFFLFRVFLRIKTSRSCTQMQTPWKNLDFKCVNIFTFVAHIRSFLKLNSRSLLYLTFSVLCCKIVRYVQKGGDCGCKVVPNLGVMSQTLPGHS